MRITNFIIKTVATVALVSPVACSSFGTSDQAASGKKGGSGSADDDCTLTQGYWKNHPDAWPVSSLTLGSVSYTKDELIAILKTPVKGNGLISLAHQLIAAKLNIAAGAPDAAVSAAITQADALIGSLVVPPKGAGTLSTASTATIAGKLDAFNNGDIGPGHCGDDDEEDCDHDNDGDCDEDCDHDNDGDCDGDDDSCDHDTDGDGACDQPTCGNTMVETGETCDDGNTVSGDGCSSTCTLELPVCGNGVIENGETCDDGNTNSGDGCSSVCICEPCIH
jgi:cysteine-rich repeat protein